MSDTLNLALPYLAASQAQKHVTHNEALTLLDGLVQLSVKSRVVAAPPGSPIDGDRYQLSPLFTVLATENPIELAGTFPLPEAQLDRFLFKLSLGYASPEAEVEVLMSHRTGEAIDTIGPVVSTEQLVAMIDWANHVTISEVMDTSPSTLCEEKATAIIATITTGDFRVEGVPPGPWTAYFATLLQAESKGTVAPTVIELLPDETKSIP